MRRSEARVRSILDTAIDAIVTTDESGCIVGFNPAAARIFGLDADACRRPAELADLIIPPAAARGPSRRHAALSGRAASPMFWPARRARGAARRRQSGLPIELTVTEVPLPQGRLFTAIIRDVSERKRFQPQLADSDRQRAVLARHFSPNMVEELMRTGGQLDAVRTQPIAVLFADLFNFTALSATMPSDRRGRPAAQLPRPGGGSGVRQPGHARQIYRRRRDGDLRHAAAGRRATPPNAVGRRPRHRQGHQPLEPRARRDAAAARSASASACTTARPPSAMSAAPAASSTRWSATTVNLASRIEALTRTLDIALLVSEAVIEAVRREGGEAVMRRLPGTRLPRHPRPQGARDAVGHDGGVAGGGLTRGRNGRSSPMPLTTGVGHHRLRNQPPCA